MSCCSNTRNFSGIRNFSRLLALAMVLCAGLNHLSFGQSALPGEGDSRDELFRQVAAQVAELEARGNLLKKVVRLVKPSVVHIDAQKQEVGGRFGATKTVDEAGAGVVIEIGGKNYVLTNRHVVVNAPLRKTTIVLADGREIHPTRVWDNRETDIAVLEVDAPRLFPARVGSSDKVEIGDFVIAVGSPFGLSHSVTYGIISAKGRRDLELGDAGVLFQDFLQTDAAINPGNSGGPLMNLRGELIGINTAIASNSGGNEGIGFTIPSRVALSVAWQLVTQGKVVSGFLGVQMSAKFGLEEARRLGMPRLAGVLISGVVPDSPADAGGLLKDDVILKFDGVRVESDVHLSNLARFTRIGKDVKIVIYRDGKPGQLQVVIASRE